MDTRRSLLLAGFVMTILVGLIFATFNKTSAGEEKVLKDSPNAPLTYSLNTKGEWAYIEVNSGNNMGFMELAAKMLSELDKAVAATGKKCGEHLMHITTSAVKGVLCKVEEK